MTKFLKSNEASINKSSQKATPWPEAMEEATTSVTVINRNMSLKIEIQA